MIQNKRKYKSIVLIRYGSHLYGTNTTQSDLDIKGIYFPTAREILLQRVEPVIVATRNKGIGEKNDHTDVDYDLYSPEKFLRSVAKGQSFALEMLFAPESTFLERQAGVYVRLIRLRDLMRRKYRLPIAAFSLSFFAHVYTL